MLGLDSSLDNSDSISCSSLGSSKELCSIRLPDHKYRVDWALQRAFPPESCHQKLDRFLAGRCRDSGGELANLLPVVLLWQHDQVVGWLKAQQRHRATSDQSTNKEMLAAARARREGEARRLLISCVICLLAICLFLVGVLIYNQQSMPPAARESSADAWKEVRRAIPVR